MRGLAAMRLARDGVSFCWAGSPSVCLQLQHNPRQWAEVGAEPEPEAEPGARELQAGLDAHMLFLVQVDDDKGPITG